MPVQGLYQKLNMKSNELHSVNTSKHSHLNILLQDKHNCLSLWPNILLSVYIMANTNTKAENLEDSRVRN